MHSRARLEKRLAKPVAQKRLNKKKGAEKEGEGSKRKKKLRTVYKGTKIETKSSPSSSS